MRRVLSWFLLAALAFAMAALVSAVGAGQSPAAPPVDVQTIGPKVGDPVPDFTLPDQSGQPRSLQSLKGPKGLMLVFFRSADW